MEISVCGEFGGPRGVGKPKGKLKKGLGGLGTQRWDWGTSGNEQPDGPQKRNRGEF